MLTLQDIGIREFQYKENQVIKSSKGNAPISVALKNSDFLESKPYWTTSKIVNMNSHAVMQDIHGMLKEIYPNIEPWGDTYIYRDKVDIHGYVDSYKEHSTHPVLHPAVPISELAFSRVISKINILGDSNNLYNASIALKWEPKEIQIAIGTNVKICDNFNIMGASTYLKTNRGLTYDNLRYELRSHLSNVNEQFGTSIETINRLIDKQITAKQTRLLLGDLMTRYDSDALVINYTDIHEVSKKIVSFEKEGRPVKNLWDLTNIGTDVLRFENSAGDSNLEHIQNWNMYLENILSASN